MISFKPDLTKMVQEVLFSRKKSKFIHPSLIFNGKDVSHSESDKDLGLMFNGKDVSHSESDKHLGLMFDPKLNFDRYLKGKCYQYTRHF